MKGLMAKLKGLKFKQLLVSHGEKFVLGTVGLIVLLALFSTTWAGYEKKPDELLSKATEAGTKLHTGDMPEDKLKTFAPSTYQRTAMEMFVKMNNPDAPSPFAYDKPMSFPLYPRQEPRAETAWPVVQHLLADSDVMVIGINTMPEFGEGMEGEMAEGEEGIAPRIPSKSNAGPLAGAPAGPMPTSAEALGTPPMPGMMSGMMASGGTGMQPRGQRYVAVRGIVNLFEIGRAIQKANHLESLADGIAAIEVIDFKIERQKAVAGDNPWPDDTWQEVSLDRADEVLAESSQAADLVDAGVTNPVFTMPLPGRLDGDYTTIVSHPMLKDFQLSKEQRELEQKLNAAFLDAASELGIDEEQSPRRRGFLKDQVDINSVRTNVMGAMGGKMDDIYKRANVTPGAGAMMPPGMGSAAGMRSSMMSPPGMGSRMPPQAASPPMMPMMPMMSGGKGMGMNSGMGMGMPGMGGMMGQGGAPQIGGSAVGYLMLFRFLDFDVNPGEAYRYRVKLEFVNPNFGLSLDQVKEASVAEGESRLSDWSEPTAPVVVKPDTNFFLAKVDKRARTRGEAEFHIFQWDPGLGTYIDSKKLVAKYGQFVGGLEESDRLDLGVPSLDTKTVLFASKDFLLDTSLPPTITPAEHADLNLPSSGRQAKELDLPAEAVVIDEYGELRVLDSVSDKSAEEQVEKIVKNERAPFEALREAAGTEANALNQLNGEGGPPGMMEMMMMGGPGSNLKRGKNGKAVKSANSAAGPGGYGTAPGYPGGKAGSSRSSAGGGYGTAPSYPGTKSKKSAGP